ncbi:hypothetical protein Ait01nite_074400 [Actinoplanes italicus]|nr:hypothetical protein Ait01nite_074400 [Actinoplanes italicus]
MRRQTARIGIPPGRLRHAVLLLWPRQGLWCLIGGPERLLKVFRPLNGPVEDKACSEEVLRVTRPPEEPAGGKTLLRSG